MDIIDGTTDKSTNTFPQLLLYSLIPLLVVDVIGPMIGAMRGFMQTSFLSKEYFITSLVPLVIDFVGITLASLSLAREKGYKKISLILLIHYILRNLIYLGSIFLLYQNSLL